MRTLSHRIFLAFALSLPMASVSSAATITQTFTQPQSATTWSVANIAFNLFNPGLGTLNSVTFGYSGSFSQSASITVVVGVPAQTISAYTGIADILIYRNANFVNQLADLNATSPLVSFPGITIPAGSTVTLNGGNTFSLAPQSLATAPFIGVGTTSFSLAGTSGFSVSGGGLANFAVSTSSGGTLSLVYTYDPQGSAVPEPSTLALSGLAAAALLFIQRRRK